MEQTRFNGQLSTKRGVPFGKNRALSFRIDNEQILMLSSERERRGNPLTDDRQQHRNGNGSRLQKYPPAAQETGGFLFVFQQPEILQTQRGKEGPRRHLSRLLLFSSTRSAPARVGDASEIRAGSRSVEMSKILAGSCPRR